MRILMISFVAGGADGIRAYLDQTANMLKDAGQDVYYFIMTDDQGIIKKYTKQKQTAVYYLPINGHIRWFLSENIFNLSLYRKLRSFIVSIKPEIVHFHDLRALRTLMFASRGFTRIWTAHYLAAIHPMYELIAIPESNGAPSVKNICQHLLIGKLRPARFLLDYWLWNDIWLKKLFNAVICPSQIVLTCARRHGIKRTFYLPHYSRFKPSLSNNNEEKYFLYVGRLENRKGIKYLLTGFYEAFRQNADLRLMIVGNGPLEKFVQDFIDMHNLHHAVQSLGFKNDTTLTEYYRNAIAVIIPSIASEAGPLVALEAMSAGKAIIASDVGGLTDLVYHNQNGLLVTPRNSQEIAKALQALFANRLLAHAMGEAGQNLLITRWTPTIHLNRLISIYKSLLTADGCNNWQKILLNRDRKKIILSPHHDDLALSIGGLAKHWQNENINVEDWIVFSLGNYMTSDTAGNNNFSPERIASVSQQRYCEELSAADELGIKTVKQLGCYEAKFRGHAGFMAPSQKAHPLTDKDRQSLKQISEAIAPLLERPIDLFVPLAIGGHYDHIMVREAVCSLLVKRRETPVATIFFYEDLPYAAEATWRQWLEMHWLMRRWKLKAITAPIDLERKINLLRHYPSQFDPLYASGITARGRFLQRRYRLGAPAERIFLATTTKASN